MHLVIPGVGLQPASQGQGRSLREIVPVQLGRHPLQFGHPRSSVELEQGIPELGCVESFQLFLSANQLGIVETRAGQFVLVHGVLQIGHGLLGGRRVVGIGVVHANALEGALVRKQQTVIERVAGVYVVAERHVSQFHGHHRSDRFLIGQGVEQALADEDGVADGRGFEGGAEQNPAMHGVSKRQVVRHGQVDHNLIQDRRFIAPGSERRCQAGLFQPVEHVVLGLRDPGAGSLQRAHILRVLTLVHRVVHLHVHVFAIAGGQFECVAPEVSLGPQADGFAGAGAFGLLHVNRDRQPEVGLHVHPPTVEVEVESGVIV